jgi:hypothetical protein
MSASQNPPHLGHLTFVGPAFGRLSAYRLGVDEPADEHGRLVAYAQRVSTGWAVAFRGSTVGTVVPTVDEARRLIVESLTDGGVS